MLTSSTTLNWKCAILAINKYKNITSAKVVDEVKHIIFSKVGEDHDWLKLGHGGTLDETATGVLVVGVGLGCKMLSNFLHGSKCYRVKAELGSETDTLNETGSIVLKAPYDHVNRESIAEQCKQFQGRILQIPPKYSALKCNGRRLSDLTREGINVPLDARRVDCYSIRLIDYLPPSLELEVHCGGGFYIRSLVRDLARGCTLYLSIGFQGFVVCEGLSYGSPELADISRKLSINNPLVALGTCGHVTELHRSKHGFIHEKDALPREMWSYDNLLKQALRIKRRPQFISTYSKMIAKQHLFAVEKRQRNLRIDPS